jgi:hypothetical protein
MGGGDWAKEDTRRMLHAVYRVGPMDEYCKFMDACFGMKQLRYRDIPEEKYTNAFIRVWAGDDKLLHGAHVQLRR